MFASFSTLAQFFGAVLLAVLPTWPSVQTSPYCLVANRNGMLTHLATGFDSGGCVRAGSKRKRGRISRTASVNRS